MPRPDERRFLARRCWLRAAASIPMAAMGAWQPTAAAVAIQRVDFRTSDGVRLSTLTAGIGESETTLVFVPGWSMPAELFRRQLQELGARYSVVALDPRGQGESDVPSNGYTLERRTADIAELLERRERVVLAGWSLGVLEVLQYVATHGESRLAGVMLIDNSVGEPPVPQGGDFVARLRADRARTLAGFVRSMFKSPQPDERLADLTRQAMRLPLDASVALLSYPRPREHWRDIARGIGVPLAYVVTPRFAEQAASLRRHRPATRIEVFERAGHALFVDEPDRFNEVVHDFIASLAGR